MDNSNFGFLSFGPNILVLLVYVCNHKLSWTYFFWVGLKLQLHFVILLILSPFVYCFTCCLSSLFTLSHCLSSKDSGLNDVTKLQSQLVEFAPFLLFLHLLQESVPGKEFNFCLSSISLLSVTSFLLAKVLRLMYQKQTRSVFIFSFIDYTLHIHKIFALFQALFEVKLIQKGPRMNDSLAIIYYTMHIYNHCM